MRSGSTYQIQVQAINDEGESAWSNTGSGTTLTAPTVSSVAFTSTPPSGQNNTYALNDTIDVTVTFDEAVDVTGTPQIDLTIGSKAVRQADYESSTTTTQLLFQYAVATTDNDTDGASINENGLKLNDGQYPQKQFHHNRGPIALGRRQPVQPQGRWHRPRAY